jgi:hypothetical protein
LASSFHIDVGVVVETITTGERNMKPVIFLQGEEAYQIIDLDDQNRDLMVTRLMEYLPDDLHTQEETVQVDPKKMNYRIVFSHNEYTIGYTTGDGGCLGVYLTK